MDIKLPKRIDGKEPSSLFHVRQITVIGANGAGKTRFSKSLIEECGEKAYKLSALKAIFPESEKDNHEGSIGTLYEKATSSSFFLKSDASSEFEKLIFLLLHDEFIDLLKYKTDLQNNYQYQLPDTKLDKVIKHWESVFPRNKILKETGKLRFSSDVATSPYSSLKLSDGEKAVLYYLGSVLYACPNAVIFVNDPGVFLHHSIMQALWNQIEESRPDCTFIYNTHDIEFALSRTDNTCIWVRNYDPAKLAWDYEIIEAGSQFSEALYVDLLGSRKPILFIEGDEKHSIDSKLYPLIFQDYTVKPLGSCNKVIESTRTFNSLQGFHNLDSHGIVDRDRRDDKEVQYLRDKKVFVPNVAEIENILMLEGVIRTVAQYRNRDQHYVFRKVKKSILSLFRAQLSKQVLLHVRHRVKRNVEFRIDRKFQNIDALEDHMIDLVNEINPRGMYQSLYRDFNEYLESGDYSMVLKVFNEKTILSDSNVAQLCGLNNKDEYIKQILSILKQDGKPAQEIRRAIKYCFGLEQ